MIKGVLLLLLLCCEARGKRRITKFRGTQRLCSIEQRVGRRKAQTNGLSESVTGRPSTCFCALTIVVFVVVVMVVAVAMAVVIVVIVIAILIITILHISFCNFDFFPILWMTFFNNYSGGLLVKNLFVVRCFVAGYFFASRQSIAGDKVSCHPLLLYVVGNFIMGYSLTALLNSLGACQLLCC